MNSPHQVSAASTPESKLMLAIRSAEIYQEIIQLSQQSNQRSQGPEQALLKLLTQDVCSTQPSAAMPDVLAMRSAQLFQQIAQLSQQLASQRLEHDLVQLIQESAPPQGFLNRDRNDVAAALVSMRGGHASQDLADKWGASVPKKKKRLTCVQRSQEHGSDADDESSSYRGSLGLLSHTSKTPSFLDKDRVQGSGEKKKSAQKGGTKASCEAAGAFSKATSKVGGKKAKCSSGGAIACGPAWADEDDNRPMMSAHRLLKKRAAKEKARRVMEKGKKKNLRTAKSSNTGDGAEEGDDEKKERCNNEDKSKKEPPKVLLRHVLFKGGEVEITRDDTFVASDAADEKTNLPKRKISEGTASSSSSQDLSFSVIPSSSRPMKKRRVPSSLGPSSLSFE